MNFLFDLLFNFKFLVGFINNGVFKEKLSDEEENICINQLFNKDTHEDARIKLIEHNLRLVAHIAKKYDNTDESNEDLISIGTIGLIKAIDTYSLEKKVKLATYAARCIENEILMAIRSNKKYSKDMSIYEAIGTDKDGNKINLIDVIKDDKLPIEDELYLKDNIDLLKEFIQKLNKLEKEIIIRRYGLDNKKAQTQKEIAHDMNISRSYVSRIEKRAISKILREFIKKNKNNY